MISNRYARKPFVTNCNSIISKNYLRFLVDSNDFNTKKLISYPEPGAILVPDTFSHNDIF